eukprot:gene4388-4972_t
MAFTNRFRPLLVTFLLILFYGSGSIFVAALSIMLISSIITFVCFIFKIQIEFDYLSILFKKVRSFALHFGLQQFHHDNTKIGGFHCNYSSLKDLPRPIARKIRIIIDNVMKDFVESWYLTVGGNEKQFMDETRKALETISVEGYKKICSMDTHSTAIGLVNLLTKHIKTFSDCCNAVNSKYPGINQKDFEQCITELYETRVKPHITSRNQGTELDFLRNITDMILFKLLPHNAFTCEGGRFMLREILAINGLYKLVNLVSDPYFVNEALIDIFEEPAPFEKLLRDWADEEGKDLYMDDDDDDCNLQQKRHRLVRQASVSSESETDDKNEHKELLGMNKSLSESSIENLTDTLEAKFVTPNHSTTEWSSAEEANNAFDRVLRQNQLEARMPAPVYGSTMVKLYDDNHEKDNIQNQLHSTNEQQNASNSGKKYFQSKEIYEQQSSHENDNISVEASKTTVISPSFAPKTIKAGKMKPKEKNMHQTKQPNSWGYCPPSTSQIFRKESYEKMNKKQDKFYEQVKAKFHSIGNKDATEASCLNLSGHKDELSGINRASIEPSLDDEILKVHSVPERNIFYEMAPTCPTCIEMTSLANPLKNGSPTMANAIPTAKEHECGLLAPHLFYSENYKEEESTDEDDKESFISCEGDQNTTDLDISIDTEMSESTLLASSESIGENNRSYFKGVPAKPISIYQGSFDIVSLCEDSEIEFSSVDDSEENAYLSDNEESDKLDESHSEYKKARSVTTFASAVDSSIHGDNEARNFATPFDKLVNVGRHNNLPALFKRIKFPSMKKEEKSKSQRAVVSPIIKGSISTDDEYVNSPLLRKSTFLISKNKKRKKARIQQAISSYEVLSSHWQDDLKTSHDIIHIQSSFSVLFVDGDASEYFVGATDTETEVSYDAMSPMIEYNSLLESQAPYLLHGADDVTEFAVDEMHEADFDAESEIFEDAQSMFELPRISSPNATAAVLTESTRFSDETDLVVDDERMTASSLTKPDGIIPIYEGEVILPNPGKIVSTWLYPIQMISIPTTEVAFEKTWEPGGNKYTLYNIHYDIRIWPEIYKRELLEASAMSSGNDVHETLPLIREIKRRYREFMYLHNRLTHSQMSVHMKGVLRPNRRYAMPFGRMDPDVIAGRRKILESYLVSLVSRPDVCNSREFKEFLGAEGYGNPLFIKPKLIQPKQMENKFVGSIKNTLAGSNYITESSRYFIHGYDVPRMFGYSDTDTVNKHSLLWFSNFVAMQIDRDMRPEGQQSTTTTTSAAATTTNRFKSDHIIGQVEFFQKPKLYSSSKKSTGFNDRADGDNNHGDELGPRLSGDGSESTNDHHHDHNLLSSAESPDRRFSVGIASLFSDELAKRTRDETLSVIDARKVAEEIPWPLTDACMSFICQALKGLHCWLTYENVQQAVLYSIGGILEWKISELIDEIVMKVRWMKYLGDIHDVIWENGQLKEPAPIPNENEKREMKEKAVRKFLEFLPAVVRIIIGNDKYENLARELLHSLQYEKINRHVLYDAVELIIGEFIPEIQDGFTKYKSMAQTSNH